MSGLSVYHPPYKKLIDRMDEFEPGYRDLTFVGRRCGIVLGYEKGVYGMTHRLTLFGPEGGVRGSVDLTDEDMLVLFHRLRGWMRKIK